MKSPLESSTSSEGLSDHRELTWRGFAHVFLLVILSGLALAIVQGFFARASWLCELTTAFTLPHFVAAVLVLAGLLALRAWVSSALALVCVVWLGVLVAPYAPYRAVRPVDVVGQPVRVLLTNVFTKNRDFMAVRKMVEESSPDLIVAQEVDADWVREFSDLELEYPHHHSLPRPDNFGLGVWSRFPLSDITVRNFGDSTVPAIMVTMEVNGAPVKLLTVHTLPPLLKHYADTRNSQLAEIGRVASEIQGPLILVGDLNVTPWSPFFTDMVKQSGLRSARHGHGIYPTWPTDNPWIPALCPIDHILVSDEVMVADFQRGPRVGSDHHPVWADVLIPAAAPPGQSTPAPRQ